jgi:hypothetical protein
MELTLETIVGPLLVGEIINRIQEDSTIAGGSRILP